MQTVVVSYTPNCSKLVDNVHVLPGTWVMFGPHGKPVRVICHSDFCVTTGGDRQVVNADILLMNEDDLHRCDTYNLMFPELKTVMLTRLPKSVQQGSLNTLIQKKYSEYGFRTIRFWGGVLYDNVANMRRQSLPRESLILKPELGASGVAQLKIDGVNHCPVNVELALERYHKTGVGDKMSDKDFADLFGECLKYAGVPREAISVSQNDYGALYRSRGDYYFTEVVDVESEWRVIFRKGVEDFVLLVYKRGKNGHPDFPQPDGVTPLTDEELNELAPQLNVVKSILHDLGQEFGSLDLFQDKAGRFGIFELSTQFGYYGADLVELAQFHQAFIEDQVLDYLSTQNPHKP